MSIKIGIANRKGGIGKSSTALALAAGLKKRGYKILMIDTDPQRNTTNVYKAKTEGVATLYDIIFAGYKSSECIQHTEYGDIIASDENLQNADTQIKPSPGMYKYIRNAVKEVEDDYDFIIYDTQPYSGILLGNVLMSCQYIITPCTCDAFGIQGIMDFYDTIKEYQEDNEKLSILGLLIIKYKGRQNLTKDIEDNLLPEYAKQMNTKVFKTRIRESVKCQEAQTMRESIFDYAPKCTTAVDYDKLIDEILAEVM
ncbi:MAG: ParA family protein [Acutalibacteraceae bacterium]